MNLCDSHFYSTTFIDLNSLNQLVLKTKVCGMKNTFWDMQIQVTGIYEWVFIFERVEIGLESLLRERKKKVHVLWSILLLCSPKSVNLKNIGYLLGSPHCSFCSSDLYFFTRIVNALYLLKGKCKNVILQNLDVQYEVRQELLI